MDNQTQPEEKKGYGYGKRPLWQWILIYVVVGGIIYFLIYYFVFAKNGHGYSTTNTTPTTTITHNAPLDASNIYKTQTSTKGTYLTDFQGTTLYTSTADTTNVSNCTGSCAQTWPPYTSGAVSQGTFPTNITVITRSDGTKQFAYKGMPLYYYSGDTKAGDTTGDGLGTFQLAKY